MSLDQLPVPARARIAARQAKLSVRYAGGTVALDFDPMNDTYTVGGLSQSAADLQAAADVACRHLSGDASLCGVDVWEVVFMDDNPLSVLRVAATPSMRSPPSKVARYQAEESDMNIYKLFVYKYLHTKDIRLKFAGARHIYNPRILKKLGTKDIITYELQVAIVAGLRDALQSYEHDTNIASGQ